MPLAHPITPHLWFNQEARAAAEFYCSVFPDGRISHTETLHGTPSGECDIVSFQLGGQPFMAISAGPHFSFTPAISFIVNFDPSRDSAARTHLDELWAALVEGGQALMPLDKYPPLERFGWVQDRFGVTWQLILSNPDGDPRPFLIPSLMFSGAVYGKAEEAGGFYRSIFEDSRPGQLLRWPAGMEPEREGAVMFSDFRVDASWFAAMDSGHQHGFGFSEAISFVIRCRDQAEIDRYWTALSSVPEAEQCGWCKDPFGVSWQIVPAELEEMMRSGDREKIDRVTQAFLKMKKFDLAKLQEAYTG